MFAKCKSALGLLAMLVLGMGVHTPSVFAQDQPIVRLERLTLSGTLASAFPGEIVIKDESGKTQKLLIHGDEAVGVRVTGQSRLLRHPAKVKVTGEFKPQEVAPGSQVRFEAKLTRLGQSKDTLTRLSLPPADKVTGGITVKEEASSGEFLCEIVGSVERFRGDRLQLKVPKNKFTTLTTLAFRVAKDAVISLEDDDYRKAGPGAKVTRCVAWRLNTGDTVVEEIDIAVDAKSLPASRVDDKLAAKFAHLSNEPQKPRQIRSAHFILQTDISERQSQILLAKLERMVPLLEKYFGKRLEGVVTGFACRDLSQFPADGFPDAEGRAMIARRGGLCVPKTLGRQRGAMIYCTDDHGTVQHEATHAYCSIAFGHCGPSWLAEGVAELGNYWKEDGRDVDIEPFIVQYLKQTSPRRQLLEIATPQIITISQADWRDYAWRWALCHLLSHNPNYSGRFKPLALGLMNRQPKFSFEATYGPVAKQISFEYDFFIEHFDNGFRADLCAWQWNRKSRPLGVEGAAKAKVLAAYGWQASGVRLEAGKNYAVTTEGKWKIGGDGEEVDGDGDLRGAGRLLGVVFSDYKLDTPFELGTNAPFTAKSSGDLYVRSNDAWHRLADNSGELAVTIRRRD